MPVAVAGDRLREGLAKQLISMRKPVATSSLRRLSCVDRTWRRDRPGRNIAACRQNRRNPRAAARDRHPRFGGRGVDVHAAEDDSRAAATDTGQPLRSAAARMIHGHSGWPKTPCPVRHSACRTPSPLACPAAGDASMTAMVASTGSGRVHDGMECEAVVQSTSSVGAQIISTSRADEEVRIGRVETISTRTLSSTRPPASGGADVRSAAHNPAD